jgi:hypothetical protein
MAANHNTRTRKKEGKTVTQYEADKGALNTAQLKQIKKLASQGKNFSVRTSLIKQCGKK